MQVKIFSGNVSRVVGKEALESRVNAFLRGLPYADVAHVETIKIGEPNFVAMFIWLRTDAK